MSTLARDVIATPERLGILLSYRPIYTRKKVVAAYDILLSGDAADAATALAELGSSVVLDAYADVYQNGRIENVPSVLRLAPATLLSSDKLSLPKKQYVIEVDCSTGLPSGLIERLQSLARQGYRLALAGYRSEREYLEPLLELVQFIRLDVHALGMDGVAEATRRLYFHHAKLLADGVDDTDQFYACADLGISYFQGDFLDKPTLAKGKTLSSNRLLLVELLAELRKPDTSPAALEQIAIKDANLTYRILKVINSAAVGLNREVSSLSQAISLLGTDELTRWANMLLVHGEPGKPDELMRSMLVRGRMCEVLAGLSCYDEPMSYFIVGLLSRLDVLTDISMKDLLRQVPLSNPVKQALLHRTGTLGQVLTEVEHYEHGRFDRLTWLVDASLYEVAYRHSVNWARHAQQALAAT